MNLKNQNHNPKISIIVPQLHIYLNVAKIGKRINTDEFSLLLIKIPRSVIIIFFSEDAALLGMT